MTIALAVLVGISVLSNVVIVFLCNRTLHEKDVLAARERESILQRIQSPISAVALHAQERIDETGFTGGVVLPYDDDEAMQETLDFQERLNG